MSSVTPRDSGISDALTLGGIVDLDGNPSGKEEGQAEKRVCRCAAAYMYTYSEILPFEASQQ
jgi:hypothetical protein